MRHDFRNSRWGHAMHMPRLDDDGNLTAMSHSTPVVMVGDEVVYETAYGWAIARVTESYIYPDPDDMAKWTAEIFERYVSEQTRLKILAGAVDKPPFPVVNL